MLKSAVCWWRDGGVGQGRRASNEGCGSSMSRVHASNEEIQTTSRDYIKSMCEIRPYENSNNPARISSKVSVKKLECIISQIGAMREAVAQYQAAKPVEIFGLISTQIPGVCHSQKSLFLSTNVPSFRKNYFVFSDLFKSV